MKLLKVEINHYKRGCSCWIQCLQTVPVSLGMLIDLEIFSIRQENMLLCYLIRKLTFSIAYVFFRTDYSVACGFGMLAYYAYCDDDQTKNKCYLQMAKGILETLDIKTGLYIQVLLGLAYSTKSVSISQVN